MREPLVSRSHDASSALRDGRLDNPRSGGQGGSDVLLTLHADLEHSPVGCSSQRP